MSFHSTWHNPDVLHYKTHYLFIAWQAAVLDREEWNCSAVHLDSTVLGKANLLNDWLVPWLEMCTNLISEVCAGLSVWRSLSPLTLATSPLTSQHTLLPPCSSHDCPVTPRTWTSLLCLLGPLPTQRQCDRNPCPASSSEWAAARGGREGKSMLLLWLDNHEKSRRKAAHTS